MSVFWCQWGVGLTFLPWVLSRRCLNLRFLQGGAVMQDLLLFLSRHRRVVLLNEHLTSQKCSRCGDDAGDDRVTVKGRTVTCNHCEHSFDRDENAARNLWRAFWSLVHTKQRPRYLSGKLVGRALVRIPVPATPAAGIWADRLGSVLIVVMVKWCCLVRLAGASAWRSTPTSYQARDVRVTQLTCTGDRTYTGLCPLCDVFTR